MINECARGALPQRPVILSVGLVWAPAKRRTPVQRSATTISENSQQCNGHRTVHSFPTLTLFRSHFEDIRIIAHIALIIIVGSYHSARAITSPSFPLLKERDDSIASDGCFRIAF